MTATFDKFCSDFGWDVSNTTAAAVTAHVEVNGTPVGAPVVVAPGTTAHVPLDPNTAPASQVSLVLADGTVLYSFFVRFCIDVANYSATIAAGATYTKGPFIQPALMAPSARHGAVTVINVPTEGPAGQFLRYTPDPCFAGTDSFGYRDIVLPVQGVITVTVLPGACRIAVHRSATDCATNTDSYTASNPYSLPAHLIQSNSTTPGADRDLALLAHRTMVIATVTFEHPTAAARVTFAVRDTTHTVLTDHVTFPCPSLSGESSGLAATGAALAQLAAFGAAAILIGALITGVVRRRKPRTPRS